MRNAVVIKSSKAGMTVILDPELPFDELLDAIGKKFSESARFWGSVQMTLTLGGPGSDCGPGICNCRYDYEELTD